MALDETRRLADGNEVPLLGLGVWQIENGPKCVDAVRSALEVGYRHIDTAQAYGNEESVGTALRESGIAREDVFVTTKFHPRRDDPVAELEASLRRLKLDHVDLYLVHWPVDGPLSAWPGMERAKELGLTTSIGVSNFDTDELAEVVAAAGAPPVVNQVRFSPFDFDRELLDACEASDVVLEAYSPLGTGKHLDDATVARIADKVGRTPAQVLIRWGLQHNVPEIPKSANVERIRENAQVFDFVLADEDLATLDGLDGTR